MYITDSQWEQLMENLERIANALCGIEGELADLIPMELDTQEKRSENHD